MFEILKNFFGPDTPEDKPEIIKQLEQTISRKLEKLDNFGLVGYMQDGCNQITELSLINCDLKELPPEIIKLQNLIRLDLRNNDLNYLPPEIGQLQNLTELDLGENQLSDLPPEIGKLQNLTILQLRKNQFSQFPKVLLDLNLEVLWNHKWEEEGIRIYSNPFQTPPIEIVKQGRQAIVDYYAALEEQDRPLNESKLILIGDGGAGKTSLMKRLLGLDFNRQESQTHGININTLTLQHNNDDIKLHCWDFGGQQIMHAIHQFFCPNAVYTYSYSTVGVKRK